MAAVIGESSRQTVVELDPRHPSGEGAEAAVVGDKVADVDLLSLLGEFAPLEGAAAIGADERLGERQERIGLTAPDIESEACGLLVERGEEEPLDRIIDKEEL